MPDNKYSGTVVGLAQRGALFLFDLGYCKVTALAQIAAAEADFLTRLNHQTALYAAEAGRLQRVELPRLFHGKARSLVEHALDLGARARLAVRRIAARVPEAIVNERRRQARRVAKKRGYPPSPAHLTLLAWTLFIPKVPSTVWTPATVCTAYSLRWQVELVCKSCKSALHLATLPTKTAAPTLGYLYGRLLLIVLAYALGPALRTARWSRQRRELSFLKLVRYLQALADRWLQALFESAATLCHWLSQVWISAQRVITKASRTRRTSAQRLRESLEAQNDFIELTIKLAA